MAINTSHSSGPPPRSTGDVRVDRSSKKGMYIVISVSILILAMVLGALLLFMGGGKGTAPTIVKKVLRDSAPSAVALETEYNNPFEPDTQYVNPFQEYKSPFQSLQ